MLINSVCSGFLCCRVRKTHAYQGIYESVYQLVTLSFAFTGGKVRYGLSSRLGFTENIHNIDEAVRKLIWLNGLFEMYGKAILDYCVWCYVKGLYKKALASKIKTYTGNSSLYKFQKNQRWLVIRRGLHRTTD